MIERHDDRRILDKEIHEVASWMYQKEPKGYAIDRYLDFLVATDVWRNDEKRTVKLHSRQKWQDWAAVNFEDLQIGESHALHIPCGHDNI